MLQKTPVFLLAFTVCTLLFFLFFPISSSLFAATITIATGPAELTVDESYEVGLHVAVSAIDGTQYYLRGIFSKINSTNYCGYTWNGTTWFSGPYTTNNGWKNFLPITITNNGWNGEIKAKLDTEDSGCKDSGQYQFKIERFTSSGSGIFDDQNTQMLTISVSTVTSTPVIPSPTRLAFISPTKTSVSPTKIELPSIEITKKSEVQVAEAIDITSIDRSGSAKNPAFLRISTFSAKLQEKKNLSQKTSSKDISTKKFPLFALIGGIILLVSSCLLGFQMLKKGKS